MDWVEGIGYLGTALTISATAMSTMIPLRIISLCASCAVITYGILIGSMPVVLTELIQMPFNAYRLWQMMRLVRDVETAYKEAFPEEAQADLDQVFAEWFQANY